ncbi:glutamate racemase [Leucobacter luti]|uniref:glutamate racemase n=1 Tax=Leucobacter luti TaxID=340320 RepID=UPI001048BE4F|nr:glutamate racemase [Leucobacter luti]MCW2288058.1 glutamate racemase [Leucobacter luti]TCK45780.1 glutamate racemase [Leucobacter luti]
MTARTISPEAPIGVFDSGVGGLTVARAIRDQLPGESMIYVGDTARTPYGPRPIAEVRRFALEILDDLVEQGVKMLVVACNTASAAVLRDARERYAVPVIEVIGPTVRSAAAITRNGRVGLIGTQGTIQSRVYDDFFAMRPEITLTTAACPRFVELVEAGETSGPEVHRVAAEYLAPLVAEHIDTLVLGCTHYPFLRGALRQVVGPDVALVSSDIETANEVFQTLTELGLLRPASAGEPMLRYEATGADTDAFVDLARRMLGIGIEAVDRVQTGTIQLPHEL